MSGWARPRKRSSENEKAARIIILMVGEQNKIKNKNKHTDSYAQFKVGLDINTW